MNKTVKNSLIVIVIMLVIFAIIWLVYDAVKEKPVDANVTNVNYLEDGNAGLDNIINELFDNVIVNEVAENTVKDEVKSEGENVEKEESNNENVSETTESVTSKEERAIELVRKEWGSSDGVYFSNESIDASGRYIVSVRDKSSTKELAFFVVDIDKELVTKK